MFYSKRNAAGVRIDAIDLPSAEDYLHTQGKAVALTINKNKPSQMVLHVMDESRTIAGALSPHPFHNSDAISI